MRAGRLRHWVTIQRATEEQNTHGETVEVWKDFANCDAAIEPLSGRESFNAQQIHADVTHKITLRYLPGITSRMRVRFCARNFHIASVLNQDERDHTLELLTIERQ